MLAERRIAGEDAGRLAYGFHVSLADQIAAGAAEIRRRTGLDTCALSGGVFQNRLLTELCAKKLREMGFSVLLHSLTPPNDGGIALGQAAVAWHRMNHQNGASDDADRRN